MPRRRKRESVTVSFHYLTKERTDDDETIENIPFTEDEFSALVARLQGLPPVDLENEGIRDMLRFRNMVPLEAITSESSRIAFGLYRGAYWGHAYENTEKGKISADSLGREPINGIPFSVSI